MWQQRQKGAMAAPAKTKGGTSCVGLGWAEDEQECNTTVRQKAGRRRVQGGAGRGGAVRAASGAAGRAVPRPKMHAEVEKRGVLTGTAWYRKWMGDGQGKGGKGIPEG